MRILVLFQIGVNFWKSDGSWGGERGFWDFGDEIVQDLGKKREDRADRIFVICDGHS